MKKTINKITVVMGILLLILLDCSELKANPKVAMPRANLQRTGVYNTRGVHELGGLKWKSKTEDEVVTDPIIFDGIVYFGGSDGYLHAVDGNTGQEKWRFKTEGSSVSSDAAVADGVVFFGSDNGYLYAVDINARQEKWKFKTEDEVSSSPTISDGVVYFNSYSHLYAVDINTGQEKWKFETEDAWGYSPAIADGVVYGVGYFGGRWDILYALDKKTGQEKWKFNTEAPVGSSPAISDRTVCFMTTDGYLHAVDSNTGQEKWTFKTEGRKSDPAIADAVVYFGGEEGYLHAVDANTGQEKWKFKTESGSVSSPSIADGIVYFGTWDGCLYAVDIKTGQEKWRFRIEAPVVSPPVIADGIVYFKSRDGLLYALEGRVVGGYDFKSEKTQEDMLVNRRKELAALKSIPYAYQGSLFLNNIYGERTVDIYVAVFAKERKVNRILFKIYSRRDIINPLAYAPTIDFPREPDKPYPLSGLITCFPLEVGMGGEELKEVFSPQQPGTWREYVFHYSPERCTEKSENFPSISDLVSGKAKLKIGLSGGHRFTIDNLKKLSQR